MKPSMIVSLMVKMRHVIFAVAILIGIFSVAFGQMYKWVDEKGTVHFTDDVSKIPEKYRTEAESRKIPKETSPLPSPPEAEPVPPAPSKAPTFPQNRLSFRYFAIFSACCLESSSDLRTVF